MIVLEVFFMEYKEVKKILDDVDKIPYPNVNYLEKSQGYAKMLYDDFGGDFGELTAITQYIYQHIALAEKEDISKTMLSIAIVEMKHIDLVGELIRKLGYKPIYVGSTGSFWDASNLRYEIKSIQDMMEYNIKSEEEAIKGYEKAKRMTRNKMLRSLFDRIILDEKTHIKIFESFLKK